MYKFTDVYNLQTLINLKCSISDITIIFLYQQYNIIIRKRLYVHLMFVFKITIINRNFAIVPSGFTSTKLERIIKKEDALCNILLQG